MTYAKLYTACYDQRLSDLDNLKRFLALEFTPGETVVELGCGSGRLSLPIVKEFGNRNFILIDSSEEMLGILNDKLQSVELSENSKLEILKSARFKIDLPSNSVDKLFLSPNTLAEMAPYTFTLSEIARVLKPGGLLHFSVENPSFLRQSRPAYSNFIPERGGDIFTVTIAPYPMLGAHSFVTLLESRGDHLERFMIAQTLPTLSETTAAIKKVGLSIVSSYGDFIRSKEMDETHYIFNLVCRKAVRGSEDCVFPALRSIYDSMAGKYDSVVRSSQYAVPEHLLEMSVDLQTQRRRVLELGCGNGNIGRFLKASSPKWSFFGIDFSREMLSQCEVLSDYEALLQADLNTGIPIFEDNYFDTLVACGITEFVEDGEMLLREMCRVLTTTGTAFIAFEEAPENESFCRTEHSSGFAKFSYSAQHAAELLTACGFSVEQVRNFEAYISPSLSHGVNYNLFRVTKR